MYLIVILSSWFSGAVFHYAAASEGIFTLGIKRCVGSQNIFMILCCNQRSKCF